MASEIWLVRHGETEWSLSGQHTGRSDISLTENGEKQAAALVDRLEGQAFDHVLCSPLKRAKDTCRLAGFGERVVLDSDLMEWDYGIYEGRKSSDLLAEDPDWTIWSAPVPKGESASDLQVRCVRLREKLHEMDGTVLVFAHAHILRCLIGLWVTENVRLGEHLTLDTASVSVLAYNRGAPVLKKLNA